MSVAPITFKFYNSIINAEGNYIITIENEKLASNAILENSIGRAASPYIQFNINQQAVEGTIFVNNKNDGVCLAILDSDKFQFTNAQVEIAPTSAFFPKEMDKKVDFSKWTILPDKQHIYFPIRALDSTVGNITLFFTVEYMERKD